MNEQAPKASGAQSVAEVMTANASRYLQQLCKHFRHKCPVSFDERAGEVAFSVGKCRLEASDDLLTMRLSAPDGDQLGQLQDVVERHLVRFAFREDPQIDWRPA